MITVRTNPEELPKAKWPTTRIDDRRIKPLLSDSKIKPFMETAHDLPSKTMRGESSLVRKKMPPLTQSLPSNSKPGWAKNTVRINPIDRLPPTKFKAPKVVVPVNSNVARKPIKEVISVASKPSAKVARLNRGTGTFVKFLKKLKIK